MAKLTSKRLRVLKELKTYGAHGATAAEVGADCWADARWARDALNALIHYDGLVKTIGPGANGATLYAITLAGLSALKEQGETP